MAQFTDIELDPDTNDIFVTDKDLALIEDTTDAIVQRIRVRLKFFKGEWFLNKLFGVPYHQRIYDKGITQSQVDGIFRSQILATPGVIEIVTFSSNFNTATREYDLEFSCRASTGETIILEV